MAFGKIKQTIKKACGVPVGEDVHYIKKIDVLSGQRLLFFRRLMDKVQSKEGDVIECGVGYGHGLVLLSILAAQDHRRLWGFDSFEGFPEPHENDKSPRDPQKGQFSSDVRKVHRLLIDSGHSSAHVASQITLVKGFFDESLPKYTGDKIAFLHIDVDLYQSYLDVLNQLYNLIVPGGVIVFDEYMNTFEHYKFPGARKAIDEFFGPKNVPIQRDEIFGGYYVVKPEGA